MDRDTGKINNVLKVLSFKFSPIFYVAVAQEELAGSVTDVHRERLAPIGGANAESSVIHNISKAKYRQSEFIAIHNQVGLGRGGRKVACPRRRYN